MQHSGVDNSHLVETGERREERGERSCDRMIISPATATGQGGRPGLEPTLHQTETQIYLVKFLKQNRTFQKLVLLLKLH